MIDWDLMDTATLHRALSGNMKPLIEKLRSGATLRQEERDFIADRLEGKKKIKRGPKQTFDKRDFDAKFAVDWLIDVEGWPRDAAANRVAEKMGETVENVRKRIRRSKSLNADYLPLSFFIGQLQEKLNSNPTLFNVGKAAGFTEEELDTLRPMLLRNEKSKK